MTQHYQVGQQIGDFTISAYNHDNQLYTLKCKCGQTASGAAEFVTRKISNLMTDGFTSCMACYYKQAHVLKYRKEREARSYVFKDVYREYIKKAKARGIKFELSLQQASELYSQNCKYCGTPPRNKRTRDTGLTVLYQGIDRVDNSIGYSPGNVVPCCKYCNSFKMDRSEDEFLAHATRIHKYKVHRLSREGVELSSSK